MAALDDERAELRELLRAGDAEPDADADDAAAELVLALDHLHSMGIAFKDLKLENVMLSGDAHVKLVDFGMAQDGLEPHSHGLGDEEVSAARGGASSATENGQKKPRPPQPMEPAVSHAIARGAFLLLHCVVCCSALLLLLGHQTKKSVKVSPHPCLPQIMLSCCPFRVPLDGGSAPPALRPPRGPLCTSLPSY